MVRRNWGFASRKAPLPSDHKIPGGVAAATFMWIMVVVYQNWYATRGIRKMGHGGPVAAAGGWLYLLQLPWVIVLLSVAFGLGFYAVVSWIARHP